MKSSSPVKQYIKTGDFAVAIEAIKDKNNLPAICGRVCPQEDQCEKFVLSVSAMNLSPSGGSNDLTPTMRFVRSKAGKKALIPGEAGKNDGRRCGPCRTECRW